LSTERDHGKEARMPLPVGGPSSSRVGPITRRRFAAGAGALLAAAGRRPAVAGAQASPPAGTPAGGYPRTITDAVGEVTIAVQPERVFSPDPGFTLDVLLHLGVAPALIGVFEGWRPLSYQQGAAGVPTVPVGASGPNIEAVRAARIDLSVIPSLYVGFFVEEGTLRQAGAPIVALPDGDFAAQLRIAGAALGLEERAEAAVAVMEASIAAYRPPRVPASVKAFFALGDGTFAMYTPASGLGRMLSLLGMPPLSVPTGVGGQQGYGDAVLGISLEAIPELEADLLIGTHLDTGVDLSEVEASPLFGRLVAVREGRYARTSHDESYALASGSALSLPLAMATLTEALGG